MSSPTKTVSTRLPESLLREASELRPEAKVSEMMLEAFASWVERIRREHEDDLIRKALASTSEEQRKEEKELAELAARSSLRILEQRNG